MLDLVSTGGTSSAVRKAARDVVAAYLNSSFGMDYLYSESEIRDLWTNAVRTNDFQDLHITLDRANNAHCPIR